MSVPLIGITTYSSEDALGHRLPRDYGDAVRRAGGIPVLCPPGEQQLEELLDRLDGFILSGGGDLDPTWYGGRHHAAIYNLDPERDRMELELARRLAARSLPILAICRGMQVMNVALGGTLVEHVPDEFGERVEHRLPERKPTWHDVEVAESSRLGEILKSAASPIVSWHHQALRAVAPGLEVVSWAADGVIEGAEHREHPWMICVQWHPEMSAATDPIQQRLFDALVRAARRADVAA